MRSTLLASLACSFALVGCGEDAVVPPDLDAPTGNHPEPRVIAGGGIGDGAIDGVVNLYVIDDDTREPIADAEVQVGELLGSTDADGLFVAEGVVGPQDVVVKAAGKRKEMWLGVNGANVTINLEKDLAPTPASKTLSGSLVGFETVPFTVAANHAKVAIVTYSQTDDLGDPANELETPADGNICFSVSGADPCNFSIVTRTGKIALFATIFDLDTKDTPADSSDDTLTVLGFAMRQGIDTATASTGQNLAVIADADTQNVTLDFGSTLSGLTIRGAIVGIEIGDEGVLPVTTAFGFTGSPSVKVPKPSALSGSAGYKLTGITTDGLASPAQSIVVRRGITGTTLAAGSWLAPPTGLTLTKQGGSWINSGDATLHGLELTSGSSRLLNVSVFDDRTSFDIPSLITLPSGPISAAVNAIGATGLDVTNFSLDADIQKLDRIAGQATTIN